MDFARCAAIARAVLYEGYNLYPYRPSALKNRRRWTFGGVFPRDWATRNEHNRCQMQTECLVQGGDALVEVRVRFLHIAAREIGELLEPVAGLPADREPKYCRVAALEIDGTQWLEWEEAKEREIAAPTLPIARLIAAPVTVPFGFSAERTIEPIQAADGRIVGVVIRTAREISGRVTIGARRLAADLFRLTVRIENATPFDVAETGDRESAQRAALASTHTLLGVERGAFVSLLDPPPEWVAAAAECENQGTWPVLVGQEGERDMLLSSPIILYDYPRIAPESPGDLFDGCEIDEILTLRILTLTEAEKREIAAADPSSRAMLERTEALTAEELARLHGTFRDAPSPPPRGGEGWGEVGAPADKPTSPSHGFGAGPSLSPLKGGEGVSRRGLRIGDRVRLRPKAGGDVMDVVLRDQVAVVEAIERDFENRVHVAVTIENDPGRDLGMARMPGHRFFFAPDEVEPVAAENAA
jgi:hypothetical protein